MPAPKDDCILPLPAPRAKIPLVTHFRGTWLTTSVRALKSRDLLDRYLGFIAPEDRESILYCITTSWVPADLIVRHYAACDRLDLPTDTLLAIGAEVTQRIHASSLALGRSVASASGVTPWTILGRLDKFWARVSMGGGAVTVSKTGPKDARIEIVGFPVAHLRYTRIATRGIITGILSLFATAVWVHEVPALCTSTTLGYRAQWA